MTVLWELGRIILATFAFAFFTPIFWVVVVLVFMQYRRAAFMERKLFGRVINSPWIQLRDSLVLGIAGGIAASALLTFFGLSLEQIGLIFIWPVAILLLLIHPRFLCFAYAGGIVALGVLAVRALASLFPPLAKQVIITELLKVHIPSLLALVALLHLLESLLIYLGGHRGSSPLYVKGCRGEVVGGFRLQRFWPLPLVALLVTVILESEIAGVSMPGWWPILSSNLEPGPGKTLQYMAVPVAAGLGYTDLALSTSPREKAASSARNLALYSLALLAAAVASEFFPVFLLPAVAFSPVGHELVVRAGGRREAKRLPRYAQPPAGVRLLAVLPGTAAARADLREGDVLLRVNGAAVPGSSAFLALIEQSYFMVFLEGERKGEPFKTILNKNTYSGGRAPQVYDRPLSAGSALSASETALHRGAALGLILVPDPYFPVYMEIKRGRRPALWSRIFTGKRR